MILFDCGNSQVKAQFVDSGRIQASFACSYDHGWSRRLASWLKAHPDDRFYLCSVLDSSRQAELDACLAGVTQSTVIRFGSEASSSGLTNGYDDPCRLGSDRWMALVGAASMVDIDCIVIDAGSAITVDMLRADGQHLGGAILPGFNTSIDAFKQIFSHIDFEAITVDTMGAPGCSTETAIRIDYEHSSTETLSPLVNRWMKMFDNEAEILLAGGDAARVQKMLDPAARIVPDLVFRGMRKLIEA